MALKSLKAIGLMSGTSLDGIDVALLDADGENINGFGPVCFRPYSGEERKIIEQATHAALKWNFEGVPPNIFAQAEEIVDQAHIEALRDFFKDSDVNSDDINLIGYHGQTILHRPPTNGKKGQTLQLGNGSKLTEALGIDTVFDFRTNDVNHGGQGAPLAPIYHKALVNKGELKGANCVLNVGGVSNVTLIRGEGDMIATDCGPGNGPLDSWISQNSGEDYDKDGRYSLAGTPNLELIERWLNRDFFRKPVPKSADRWDFDVLEDMAGLSIDDGAATLVGFTAMSIANTLKKIDQPIDSMIVCGGGRHNPTLMAALVEQRCGQVKSAEAIGWKGDDIEAQAFAFMAIRHANGLPLSFPSTTGVQNPVCGGRLVRSKKVV